MELTLFQIGQAVLAAMLVGFAKTGITGLGILIVPLMAAIFPAKASVGVLLPMLIVGDLFAVAYYRRHAQWNILCRLLPWVLPGIVAGYFTLRSISSVALAPVLGGLVLLMIVLNVVREKLGPGLENHLPRQWWFSAIFGILAGFATIHCMNGDLDTCLCQQSQSPYRHCLWYQTVARPGAWADCIRPMGIHSEDRLHHLSCYTG